MAISNYSIVGYFINAIGGYSIGGYFLLFYFWLFVVILLVVISYYSTRGYLWLFY
jgi:hypothetical protein